MPQVMPAQTLPTSRADMCEPAKRQYAMSASRCFSIFMLLSFSCFYGSVLITQTNLCSTNGLGQSLYAAGVVAVAITWAMMMTWILSDLVRCIVKALKARAKLRRERPKDCEQCRRDEAGRHSAQPQCPLDAERIEMATKAFHATSAPQPPVHMETV